MSRTVYLNGQFVPESEAKLSIYDLSVMQAAAAFEMTRSFNGKHFKLREHLERLKRSCELLSIPLYRTMDDLFALCELVSALNDHGPGEEHRLLIVASPGCAPMYKDLDGVIAHPFVYIADFPLRYTVAGFSTYFTEGVQCVTSDVRQISCLSLPYQAKHRARLHFHLAQQHAPHGTWPLMLGETTEYTEAPGANIVCVNSFGEVFYVPYSALPGISMATVAELTGAVVGSLWKSNVYLMREIFLTGTPFCMLPVVSLDGQPIGDGKIGPVYKETLAKWSELVGVDIQRQIEAWDAVRTQ